MDAERCKELRKDHCAMSRSVFNLRGRRCVSLIHQLSKVKRAIPRFCFSMSARVSTSKRRIFPRAKWISRGWVDLRLPEIYPNRNQPIVMTCADGCQSILAALALGDLGYQRCRGSRRWCECMVNRPGFTLNRGSMAAWSNLTMWFYRPRFAAPRKICSVIWIASWSLRK